jgi:hypothetical protein
MHPTKEAPLDILGGLGSFDDLDNKPMHRGRKSYISKDKNQGHFEFDLGNINHSMGILEHQTPLWSPNDHSLIQFLRVGQPLQNIGAVQNSRFTQP